MERDGGNRIHLNNIAIEGRAFLSNDDFSGIHHTNTDVKVFPNPTNGQFQILSNHPIKGVEMYNLQGQRIQDIEGYGHQIEVRSKQSAGVYVMKIKLEGGRYISRRIIIN
jgi:hypothetical protein